MKSVTLGVDFADMIISLGKSNRHSAKTRICPIKACNLPKSQL